MECPNLSYVLVTRNKLAFLRHSFPRLLSSVRDDEEIVVIDGASTDGTTEYLGDLYAAGKIHQFLSEPDKGEPHALNKGLLMARGELVKDVTDDDIFHFSTLQLCKEYMLANPEVDVMASDGYLAYWDRPGHVELTQAIQDYEIWSREGRPFVFPGLSVLLRRKSLPLLGLFSTTVMSVDHEYCRRVSSLPVCIAWCSRLSFVHLCNPASNESLHYQRVLEEIRRFKQLYNCEDPSPSWWQRVISSVRQTLRPIRRMVSRYPSSSCSPAPITEEQVVAAMDSYCALLHKQNESLPCAFRKAFRGSGFAK